MFEEIKKILISKMSEKRYNHVLRVREKAKELADIYNLSGRDKIKVELAGLLHDLAKEFEIEYLIELVSDKYEEIGEKDKINSILHGFGATEYIKSHLDDFKNIQEYLDEDFFNCLNYHTVGRENMSINEKIVYLADAIEDKRNYLGVDDIRKLSKEDLDLALILELDIKIKSLLERRITVHVNTIKMWNELVLKR